MSTTPWLPPLVQGISALLVAAALFALARWRFGRKEGPGAGTDVGLD